MARVKTNEIAGKNWTDYTPTTQGFGAITNADFQYKRVGDSLEIRGFFNPGTTSATEAQVSLPSGLSIGSTSQIKVAGFYMRGEVSVGNRGGAILATAGDTFLNFGDWRTWSTTTNIASLVPVDGDEVDSTGTGLSLVATVPISEWEA